VRPLATGNPDADLLSVNFNPSLVRSARRFQGAEDAQPLEGHHELALRGDPFWSRARLAVDLALMAAAAAVAGLTSPHVKTFAGLVLWPALFAAIVVYLSYLRGTYARRVKLDSLDDLRATGSVLAVATSVVVTLRVLLDNAAAPGADHSVRLGVFAAASLACGQIVLNLWQSQTRRRGKGLVPTLIVGAGHIGRTTARRLLEHPELGLKPIGFLDKEPLEEGDGSLRLPVLGASWDFDNTVAEHGIAVALVPRLFEKVTERLTIEHLGGLPLITSRSSNPRGWQFAVKYALDRVLALLLMGLLAPVLLGCALAVLISLGRPIMFRQRRVGRDGREFDMLKFRSLHPNGSDSETLFDLPDDTAPGGVEASDRVTAVGAFLRNTSLDELPQLLNVLKGEMSIVGPRPERPEFVELFEPRVHRYYDRQRVKAGITGWAQVNGLRGQTSLSDRVEWDNYYIENASLWLDLKIIGRTILTLPRHSGNCR
jgi:lipopolysaccharide/colanic/teichoic acid biosynthesis glycosyltransferase